MSEATTPPHSKWSGFPIRVIVEPRLSEMPGWMIPLVSIGAIVVALLIGAVILALVGSDPWMTYSHIAQASLGSWGVFSDTLVKAIPLILVGLACALAFRMKLWNIGAEGQFFLGAFGASAVVLIPILPATTPAWIFIPVMMLAGLICGALWGFIPGILKAWFNVNEIISTLMLNYVAVAWNNFFIFAVWTEGGFQMSAKFPQNAWLPRLSDLSNSIPALRGLTTHLGLVFGLVAAGLVWFILYRSRWGYQIRLIGDNPQAARYAGISIEITGVVHRLQGAISPGYGFTGIIVAWLAKLNPFAVVLVSILFGALILAGREIQPSGVPRMIQGIILVCLIASDFLIRNQVRIVRRAEEA